MGIFFKKKESDKSKYFNLIQSTTKKLYDKNRYNTFNQAYSLLVNRFTTRRTSSKLFLDQNSNEITWKDYLLLKLETSPNGLSWKKTLYNFIMKEPFNTQYIFQNKIFYEEFSLLTKPKSNKKEEGFYSLTTEPVLTSLDTRELKSLSRTINSFCVNPSLIENEISYNSNEKNNDINNDYDQHLTMNISMESITSSMADKDPKYEVQLNSFRIKKYIQIIKKHIDNKSHPINIIIHEFIKIFSPYLQEAVNYCKSKKEDKNECMKKGKNIIKQIQNFIEIMQVGLKLFYSKSINYRYFIDEKDEIINLLSYILFNIQRIYKYISQIFYYMNIEKIEKLESQFKNIGELTPKEIGIHPKFCLDKDIEEFKIELKNNKNNIININNDNYIITTEKEENSRLNRLNNFSSFLYDNKNEKENNKINNINDNNKYRNNEINLDINEKDNISINTEDNNFNKKSFRLNENYLNYLELEENEDKISTYSLKDFKDKIESYQDKMNIKDLLINDLENENFPSLPKLPNISNKLQKEPYIDAINYLRQIDTYKVPLEKLIVIALISVIITDCIDKYWGPMKKDLPQKFLNIDADELMSIYLYIIYKLKMPSLFVHLDFIRYFTTPISKQSMIGYYFTALEGCLNFILNIKNKSSFIKNST